MMTVRRIIDTESRYRERSEERSEAKQRIASGVPLEANDPERVEKRADRLQVSPDKMERIINGNELLPVNFLTRGRKAADSVARISQGSTPLGTGFMVSPRLLLTNHHVLPEAARASGCVAEFAYEVDNEGKELQAVSCELKPDAFFINDEPLDYALVALESTGAGDELSGFGRLKLIEDEGKALVGEFVNVIQHPAGRRKQISIRENLLTDITDNYLVYESDTLQGSSGSPLFNDQWEVIGLHHSGVCKKDEQGRCLSVDGRVWTEDMGDDMVHWIANEGIRASVLVRHIRARSVAAEAKAFTDEI
jgi:endonuclease G, mitochondrial